MKFAWRRPVRFAAAACCAGLLTLGTPAASAPDRAGAGEETWDFNVQLDGKPIGMHRFSVAIDGDVRTVRSEADFTVRLLGITAYRYRHRASETWRGNCLVNLQAETDDDGERSAVRAQAGDGALAVTTEAAASTRTTVPGCVMSFAYWNPAMRLQSRLLNAQTGKLEAVTVGPAGQGAIDVRGASVQAVRWRITGAEHPIDLWTSASGQWIGLDATVGGGRVLSYRLK